MGKKKILVVDFDQEFLKFLSHFLRNEGFEVVTAADGFAGLEMHKSEAPDLVITEAMLPKLHGFELCSRISHSASRKTPVIIVTGVYRDTVYKTEALHTFGASAYFEKPLDPDELMDSLRKILRLPEPKEKADDSIDAAIMEVLVPKAAASRVTGKPAAKASVGDDVDNILRSTLAEFGLKSGNRKKPAATPAPKPQVPLPAPFPASRPAADEARPAPKVAQARIERPRPETPAPPPKPEAAADKPVSTPRPGPPVMVPPAPPARALQAGAASPGRENPQPFEPMPVFGAYGENKKKGFPPRYFGAIAGVLVLTSATIFVLRPRKGRVPSEEPVPYVVEQQLPESVPASPAAEPDAKAAAVRTAGKKKNPGPSRAANGPGSTAPAVEETTAPEPEDIKPMAPETVPSLEIQPPETAPSQAEDAPSAAVTDAPIEIPAVKVRAGDIIPLGEADVPPRQVKTADPVYPGAARSLGREGSVIINILISETGDVIQTAVIAGDRGPLGFDRAAENAVRKWKFSPAEKDGVPVRVWKSVTIGFKLEK
jgi:TonB family protein